MGPDETLPGFCSPGIWYLAAHFEPLAGQELLDLCIPTPAISLLGYGCGVGTVIKEGVTVHFRLLWRLLPMALVR